jgi:uncharacterized membrane-anchored protein
MSKRRWIFSIFILVAIVQLAVIGSRIVKWETIMRTGKQFKFRAAPVDPSDVFRGRYIELNFEASSVPRDPGLKLRTDQKVFARLEEDKEGFAAIGGLSLEPPKDADFLRVRTGYVASKEDKVRVQLPFTRYYVEEKTAPAAEKAYRVASARQKRNAYALVRVKDGYGVIEDLFIGGKPIKEFLRW